MMKTPNAADPNTGTTLEQPWSDTREVLCEVWLLEYDLKIRKQITSELIRELGGERGYRSRVAYTKKILKEAQAALRRSENQEGVPMCPTTDKKVARQKLGRQKTR